MTPVMIQLIGYYIRQDFSPEQVASFLVRNHNLKISHETIYKHIWFEKRMAALFTNTFSIQVEKTEGATAPNNVVVE
jgi:IS30 family transposase